jgi:hypothetical protein
MGDRDAWIPLGSVGTVAITEPVIEGELRTPDGTGRCRSPVREHPALVPTATRTTVIQEKASLGTVQRILGDAYETLAPVNVDADGVA